MQVRLNSYYNGQGWRTFRTVFYASRQMTFRAASEELPSDFSIAAKFAPPRFPEFNFRRRGHSRSEPAPHNSERDDLPHLHIDNIYAAIKRVTTVAHPLLPLGSKRSGFRPPVVSQFDSNIIIPGRGHSSRPEFRHTDLKNLGEAGVDGFRARPCGPPRNDNLICYIENETLPTALTDWERRLYLFRCCYR
jgi:hypothetical protein